MTQIMTYNKPDFTLTSFQVPPKAIFSHIPGQSEHQQLSYERRWLKIILDDNPK